MEEEKYYLLHDSAPENVRLNMLVRINGVRVAMYHAYYNSRNQSYTLYPCRKLIAHPYEMKKHTISDRLVRFGDRA